jgi:hypothetical protein
LFSKNQQENLEFLRKFRAVLDPYKAAAVGEVGDAQRGLEIMAEYTSGGDKVQMCYPFEMLQPARLTAALGETFARLAAAAPDAWPCWAYSNHDTVRHITRWGLSDAAAKGLCDAFDVSCAARSACIKARNWVCQRQRSPLRSCRTLTASSSGPNSRAATAVARRWSGTDNGLAAFPALKRRGCR